LANGKRWKCSEPTIPRQTGLAFATTYTPSDLAQAHSTALAYLRSGGNSATFNCGYGRGASVFEVIDAVRRASGRDFPVEIVGRRAGDPSALVANVDRIRAALPWRPQFQNLDTIVAHALAWEKRLASRPKSAVV
jgi:UDP-glucose 4-epimerase